MAGIHGLQHVQRFFAANLADNDAVRTHTKAVDDQFALLHRTSAFDVWRAALQAHNVLLLQLQFGRVFHGHDSLFFRDEAREHVQQRRFSGASSAGDDDVQSCFHRALQQIPHLRRQGVVCKQILDFQRNCPEAANGQNRAIHGKRRNDHVDARSVGQAGIHHGRRFVHAAAHRGNNLIDDVHEVDVVLEDNVGLLKQSRALDIIRWSRC